ncbi:MAG: hypothetical protein NTW21_12140 [Verrucomicrobia bacterium]|nr:hypothetical protein [Verrucomicrobiota bacterium]
MSQIARPLNPAAVAAANAKVAPKTGGRPLTMGPADAALRKEWADAYRAAFAEQKTDPNSSSAPATVEEPAAVPQEMGSCKQPCPLLQAKAEEPCNCSFQKDFIVMKTKETVDGEGKDALRSAMNTLWDYRDKPNDPVVQSALITVSNERGQPLPKIQSDWQKYQKLLKDQRKAIEESKKNKKEKKVDALDEKRQKENFMASKSQLRYGNMVGACLGVDPVFGALLNPTGGIVGPDNGYFDGNDSALGYHGAVHDAAGYLRNFHNQGPGYDYLGTDNRDTTDPLSGQRNGIRFWRETLGGTPPITDRTKDALGEGVMEVVVGGMDGASKAQAAAIAAYEAAVDAASSAWDWIFK